MWKPSLNIFSVCVCRVGVCELLPVRYRRVRWEEPALLRGALQHKQECLGAQSVHAVRPQCTRSHGPPQMHLCPRSVTSLSRMVVEHIQYFHQGPTVP